MGDRGIAAPGGMIPRSPKNLMSNHWSEPDRESIGLCTRHCITSRDVVKLIAAQRPAWWERIIKLITKKGLE